MLPLCAINRPKKNHVGLRISQVKLDTPTTQTARTTIQSFCEKEGSVLRETPKTASSAQKMANPNTPCSTRTDRKVLCAGGAGESGSSSRIGSSSTRLTMSRNAFEPIPKKGCSRKICHPAFQITVRPVSVPCSTSLGTVERRFQELAGTIRRTPETSKETVRRSAIFLRVVKRV